ncbi:unnamed protein product, partial [Prorocentrum cordatum]
FLQRYSSAVAGLLRGGPGGSSPEGDSPRVERDQVHWLSEWGFAMDDPHVQALREVHRHQGGTAAVRRAELGAAAETGVVAAVRGALRRAMCAGIEKDTPQARASPGHLSAPVGVGSFVPVPVLPSPPPAMVLLLVLIVPGHALPRGRWTEDKTRENDYLKALSISSLAVYASIAKYFVIVAPPCLHHDKLVECNSATYQRRGWCRLEQWARMTVGGLRDMYIYEGGNLEQLLDRPHWYEASVKVFEGDFTVEADKYNIVDPVMGLWYIALLNADRQNIDSLLIDLVNQNKESVFPAAYFEDYIGKLEALVEQEKGSSQPRDHSVLIQSVSSSAALCEVVGAREDHRTVPSGRGESSRQGPKAARPLADAYRGPAPTFQRARAGLQAYVDAAAVGVAYAECDVWATRDGQLVLSSEEKNWHEHKPPRSFARSSWACAGIPRRRLRRRPWRAPRVMEGGSGSSADPRHPHRSSSQLMPVTLFAPL